MDCSPQDSSVHGILQARILEWFAILFFKESSQPRDWTWVSCIAGRWDALPSEPLGKTLFQQDLKKFFWGPVILGETDHIDAHLYVNLARQKYLII